jgi:sensor domain CHASE-containing protein
MEHVCTILTGLVDLAQAHCTFMSPLVMNYVGMLVAVFEIVLFNNRLLDHW